MSNLGGLGPDEYSLAVVDVLAIGSVSHKHRDRSLRGVFRSVDVCSDYPRTAFQRYGDILLEDIWKAVAVDGCDVTDLIWHFVFLVVRVSIPRPACSFSHID